MNVKYLIIIVAGFIVGLSLLNGCRMGSNNQGAIGNLKLVARYEPLHLHIYADTASTNRFPDYMVSEGDNPFFLRENTSNGFVTTYAEKGFDVLETDYDTNGNILRRFVHGRNDNSFRVRYIYADTNGDGLFDVFIVYNKNGEREATFTRSNYYWIPIEQIVRTNQ